MGTVFLFALTSMLNPTLLAASTLMMLLPNPVKLMLGYLLGAMMTSITLGLVIVFSLSDSSTVSSTKKTISPAVDIAFGALLLVLAFVLATGRASRARERRRERKESKSTGPKEPPRWQRALSKGTARTTFVIGALLTLPGASYLAGLDQIHKQHVSNAETVLLVIAFNIVMLTLLEVPLVCFAVAPDWTPGAIERTKAWIGRRGAELAARGFAVIGMLLIVKGVIGLIAAS